MTGKKLHFHKWTVARRLTAAGFFCLLFLGSFNWFRWFHGSATGTKLLDVVPFTDPLAALEVTLASRSFHATMLIGAVILILLALLLGPVFCGWICPLGLLLDLNDWLRRRVLRLLGKKPTLIPHGPMPGWFRYLALGLFAGLAITTGLPLFQTISPINLLVRSIIFATWLDLVLVGLIMILEYFWPRLWCRTLCPLGALYSLVGRFGFLRVQIDPELAGKTPCKQCTRSCPMGIRVMEDYAVADRPWIDHPSCSRCGACTDICPRDVLKLSFRRASASNSGQRVPGSCGLDDEHQGEGGVSLPVIESGATMVSPSGQSEP
ncbi:MAG TPA: 4Fe-4S binding protein [Phycisphaeraceae bacterium]|nr:4Fe-4S binding protein [Phycisphaeraceae bacterium]